MLRTVQNVTAVRCKFQLLNTAFGAVKKGLRQDAVTGRAHTLINSHIADGPLVPPHAARKKRRSIAVFEIIPRTLIYTAMLFADFGTFSEFS